MTLWLALAALALAQDEPEPQAVHGARAGVGLTLDDDLSIATVLEAGPAWQSGLRSGDRITAIDGQSTRWVDPAVLTWWLRAPEGIVYTLTVDGDDGPKDVQVQVATLDPLAGTWVGGGETRTLRKVTCSRGDCIEGQGSASTEGLTLDGTWVQGRLEGRGSANMGRGRYDGDFVASVYDGWGELLRPDGTTLVGTFDQGLQVGRVYRESTAGEVYAGEAIEGVPHGYGNLSGGAVTYDGGWQSGRYHGDGDLVLADGTEHHGQFMYGLAHGEGRLILPSGNTAEGTFFKGRLMGKGKRTFADQSVYEGDFVNSEPEGEGTLTWPDGVVHTGTFVGGKPRGLGRRTLADGRIVEGLFIDSFRAIGRVYDDLGVLVYEGWTRNGRFEGWGRVFDKDGERKEARWFFNDEPWRGTGHPRGARFGDEEKATFEKMKWDEAGLKAFGG